MHDEDDMLTFGAWWKLVDDDEVVGVDERHRLSGKQSNNAKPEVMRDFPEFVNLNSQPKQAAIAPNSFSSQSSLG